MADANSLLQTLSNPPHFPFLLYGPENESCTCGFFDYQASGQIQIIEAREDYITNG